VEYTIKIKYKNFVMEENIFKIPYSVVRKDWDFLQKYIKAIGNPRYIIIGDVDLSHSVDIYDLGNLVGIEGYLGLTSTSIQSLGELEFVEGDFGLSGCRNIKTLGKLKKVGGYLTLNFSAIESLGNLKEVGDELWVLNTNIPQSELDKLDSIGKLIR
jgi:hypothetical protein